MPAVATEPEETKIHPSDKAAGITDTKSDHAETREGATGAVGDILNRARGGEDKPKDGSEEPKKKAEAKTPEPKAEDAKAAPAEPEALDSDVIMRAKEAGWNDDDIKGFQSSHALESAVAVADRRTIRLAKEAAESQKSQQPQPQRDQQTLPVADPRSMAAQPAKTEQPAPSGVDLSHLDGFTEESGFTEGVIGVSKAVKEVHAHQQKQMATIGQVLREQNQIVQKMAAHLQNQMVKDFSTKFDTWISENEVEFGDFLGNSPTNKLAADSEFYKARGNIAQMAQALSNGTFNGFDPSLMRRAANAEFHEQILEKRIKAAKTETADRARDASGHFLADPDNRAPMKEPDDKDPKGKSIKAVGDILRKAGRK